MLLFTLSLLISWIMIHFLIFKPPRGGVLGCGIFGFSGSRPVDITKLRWLAAENQSRGNDSMGVYGNNLFKEKGFAKTIMLMPGFHSAVKGAHTVQGHTRAATVGSVSKENAHPFKFGHLPSDEVKWKSEVVGAHNGFVIPEMKRYHEQDFGFKTPFPVDSQIIFAALAVTGDPNTVSKIEGGMAISFQFTSSPTPNRLYLYKRENTRPLFVGQATDGLYYSSLYEPLRFIGCRLVWELNPNTLYTLEHGEVIDMYRMPDPALKSLPANVQRGTWRTGIPDAEIRALPDTVVTQERLLVSKQTKIPYRGNHGGTDGDETGDYTRTMGMGKGWKSTAETNRKLIKDYSGKQDENTITSKFNMLIHNIKNEFKEMGVTPINPATCSSRKENDMTSCMLLIKVVNQTNSHPLVAWSVLADNSADLAGITSCDGITAIKVPTNMCGEKIKFFVYAPVDQVGPYLLELTPERGRVMEVTLSIPFRKESDEKELQTNSNDSLQSTPNSCSVRSTECSVYPSGSEFDGLHESVKGENRKILRPETTSISWGPKERKETSRSTASSWSPPTTAVPETDPNLGVGASIQDRQKNTLPMLNHEARKVTMEIWLEKTINNEWKMPVDIGVVAWSLNLPAKEAWYDFYCRNYSKEIKAAELIQHALRLIQRDKHTQKCWLPFYYYIEILLVHRFHMYIRDSFMREEIASIRPKTFFPSTFIEQGFNPEDRKKKVMAKLPLETMEVPMLKKISVLPYSIFSEYTNWTLSLKDINKMSTDDFEVLKSYYEEHTTQLTELNDIMQTHGLTVKQRLAIRNARDFIKANREELADYLKFAKDIVKDKLAKVAE